MKITEEELRKLLDDYSRISIFVSINKWKSKTPYRVLDVEPFYWKELARFSTKEEAELFAKQKQEQRKNELMQRFGLIAAPTTIIRCPYCLREQFGQPISDGELASICKRHS